MKKTQEIPRKWLTTAQASAYTGIAASTLRKYRYEGKPPIYTKPAGRAMYNVADLDSFMESGRRVPSVRATQEQDRHVHL
jgi:predicted site-specific integrase-resolvase